jgi:hypothetical protein
MDGKLLVLFLCVQYCAGLPVDRTQVKEKQPDEVDLQEYIRYWEEMAQNDPSE